MESKESLQLTKSNNKSQYRKPKLLPSNYDQIDKWKMPEIKPELVQGSFKEESSFATLFPKYREKYIREVFPAVQRKLKDFGVKAELDLLEGSMTVRTTKKTYDPYIIIKSRDAIKLLARSVPYQMALRLLEEDIYCDIIKIKSLVHNKEKYVKRRQRLIGPEGQTLKALEILTECYIMVQGSTVSVIGNYKKLKQVRRIITDIMSNIHPLYYIKELMIKRELEKDEKLKNENWDRFLPKFKTMKQNNKKIQKISKKETKLFPDEPLPRKEDLQMQSGEYFLAEKQKIKTKQKRSEEKTKEKYIQKVQQFQKPGFQEELKRDKQKKISEQKAQVTQSDIDVTQLVKNFNTDNQFNL